MQFSDTTNKNGIIQEIEFWTGRGDGAITGDATLFARITSRVNEAFNRLMPRLLTFSSFLKWEDVNNSDLPVGTFNLVSGQADYLITEDDNSLDILNIVAVKILPSATATQYMDVEIIGSDHPYAVPAMSPESTDTGTPMVVLKRGNRLHFFPKPNYSATAGVKIFFEREQTVFTVADTTKEPGFPKPFHGLLPLYAAHDDLIVNKPADDMLITRLEAQIARREKDLDRAIKGTFPSRTRITTAPPRRFR